MTMPDSNLLELTPSGLYCRIGDFFIDPWQAVNKAVITHAHSDHAVGGCKNYLVPQSGERILKARLGEDCAAR